MPTTIRTECKNFVDQYAADLIALLVREVDPAKACELIKICPKPKNVAFLTKPNLQTCGLCDYVSTYIKADYPIENVCSHFSTENNIRQQCEILVHLYKPNICPELPLCFDDTTSEQPIKPNANPIECSLCKFVVNYVDTVIQNNRSEAAIEAALEKVCTILPHALNASCVKFVDDYGPILVQLLEKYVTPDQVCAAIKACTNATQEITHRKSIFYRSFSLITFHDLNLVQNFQSTEPKIVTPNSLQCTLCEFVINYINKQVGNNRSAAAIEAALEKVCKILPSSVRPNCISFVDKYGVIIAFLLAKNSTAEQVCDFIKVCNNGTQEIAPGKNNYSCI
jgi:saposin